METTNYAYITKLVKICDQLLGPCRPSNMSSPSGQYGTLFHVLSWYCHLCRNPQFFWKEWNSNRLESRLHSRTVVMRLHDGHERDRSAGAGPPGEGLMCDVGVCLFVLLAVIRHHPSQTSSPLQLWPCVMTVATLALVWREKMELIFVPKTPKISFCLNPLFGALPKIGDWIWKYVHCVCCI